MNYHGKMLIAFLLAAGFCMFMREISAACVFMLLALRETFYIEGQDKP